MKLVRLTEKVMVNPAFVVRIKVSHNSDGINVTMSDGAVHWVDADYGKGVYATLDRLSKELSAEDA